MKQICYDFIQLRVNHELIYGYESGYKYGEPLEMRQIEGTDFDALFNFVMNASTPMARQVYVGKNNKGRFIQYNDFDSLLGHRRIYEGKFKFYEYRSGSRIVLNHLSFAQLAKQLPATDFIAYCKDNGLTVCPWNKE